MTTLLTRRAATVCSVLMALILIATAGVVAQPKKEARAVRLAWEKTAMDAVVYHMPELAAAADLQFELREFPRHPDIKTALANGSIDFGTVTTPDLIFNLDAGNTGIIALAGEALGGDYLAMKKGLDLKSWADLRRPDLRIRTFAGGIAWLKFMVSLRDNGIAPASLNIQKIAGGPPDMALILKTGQADVVTNVDPHIAQGVHDGYAAYAPLDINKSSIGGLNAVFATRTSLLKEKPDLVEDVLRVYLRSMELLQGDRTRWLRVYRSYSGLPEDVAKESLSHITLSSNLPQRELVTAAKFMAQEKLAKTDVSGELPKYLNFDLLSKVTKKSPAELGRQP
jgi:ABC-type nitrate/sulfonate/bicarbonate transport system substrate-binding protein